MKTTTIYEQAQKLGIKNKRFLSIVGRKILAWYRENNPKAITMTESTEAIGGELKTFNVIGYPHSEAGRIQLLIRQFKSNGNKSKNNNRGNRRPRIKKSIRQN